ncbi:hypothetical protein ACLFLU_08380 [Bradyrhizobium ganzhouense]
MSEATIYNWRARVAAQRVETTIIRRLPG